MSSAPGIKKRMAGRYGWWIALILALALAGCGTDEAPPDEAMPATVAANDPPTAIGRDGGAGLPAAGAQPVAESCGYECSDEAGYRWAMQRSLTNPELCEGPLFFLEGCRRYAEEHEEER